MLSIIIILKNDSRVIDTITGLNELTYHGEVEIIVIDRSTIFYPEIKSKYYIRWIKYDPKGKRYTIPEQRNEGVKEAKGDIVVFLDANCVPKNNWLTELVKPILLYGEKIVMGNTKSKTKPTSNSLDYDKLDSSKYVTYSPTINLAISKDFFNVIGYFDESFEYGSDMDFTWRIIERGYKIRYQPDSIVTHDFGSVTEEIIRTILYGKARVRLIKKYWKTRWKYFLIDETPVFVYPLLILGLPLSFFYPIYLLSFVLLILKNIRKPNPILIVTRHFIFGIGVLIEIFALTLNIIILRKRKIN